MYPIDYFLLVCLSVSQSQDFTIFPPGQETTANLLSFSLMMLIRHPNVLDRYVCETMHESDIVLSNTLHAHNWNYWPKQKQLHVMYVCTSSAIS